MGVYIYILSYRSFLGLASISDAVACSSDGVNNTHIFIYTYIHIYAYIEIEIEIDR